MAGNSYRANTSERRESVLIIEGIDDRPTATDAMMVLLLAARAARAGRQAHAATRMAL